MEIENLWEARDKYMAQYELELQRLDSGGEVVWRFSGRDTSDNYGEHIIDVGRKDLKDLHGVIENELYPERNIPAKTDRDDVILRAKDIGKAAEEARPTFFEQAREVRKIVDEANKTVDTIWQWEDRPTNCPTCNALLRQSRYQNGEKYFCPMYHGTLYKIEINDAKMWGWYNLLA